MNKYLAAEQRSVRRSQALLHRRYLARESLITGIIIIVVLFLGLQLFRAHQQKVALRHQVRISQVNFANEKRKRRALKLNVKQLHNHWYIRQLLSKKYYYSKPGQTVYSLPGDISHDVTHN